MGCRTILLLTALAFLCPVDVAADPIRIDTRGTDGPGPTGAGAFGEPNAATFGQTFIAPADAFRLDRFTFFLAYGGDDAVRNPPAGPARFAGYVAAWDGTKASGPLLFASGERQLTTPETGPNTFTPVSFETGGIRVTPGLTYVAFLSASGFFDGLEDNTGVAFENDTFAGGNMVSLPNGDDFSQVFTTVWRSGLAPGDAGFVAELSPVPEPSTMLLVGTALAAAAARRSRRKDRRTT
jgi:hypothetical protein